MSMIGVRLPAPLEERLNRLAEETHRSKSYYVKCAIEEFLDDQEDYLLALAVSERVKSGKERTYTLDEIKKKYGFDDQDA